MTPNYDGSGSPERNLLPVRIQASLFSHKNQTTAGLVRSESGSGSGCLVRCKIQWSGFSWTKSPDQQGNKRIRSNQTRRSGEKLVDLGNLQRKWKYHQQTDGAQRSDLGPKNDSWTFWQQNHAKPDSKAAWQEVTAEALQSEQRRRRWDQIAHHDRFTPFRTKRRFKTFGKYRGFGYPSVV